jgi:hypothetical protein
MCIQNFAMQTPWNADTQKIIKKHGIKMEPQMVIEIELN